MTENGEPRKLKILAMALMALLAGLLTSTLMRHRPKPQVDLVDFGSAPAFQLTDQRNQPFDSTTLAGKVWVASFVYTSCKESCPMLAAQMKRLAQSMPSDDAFRMLSISVDPEKDTPERLSRYARDLGVEDPRWIFLTGNKKYIQDLVLKGFRLAVVPEPGRDPSILHSSMLVLVDSKGRVRGLYEGLFGESAEQIRRAAEALMREAP